MKLLTQKIIGLIILTIYHTKFKQFPDIFFYCEIKQLRWNLLAHNYYMLKSQFISNDIYPNKSDNQSEIIFKIDNIDGKYMKLLNNAEGSDFTIVHGYQSYPVHKTVIFKHMNLHVLDLQFQEGVLKVPEEFDNEVVKGIISSLYGFEFNISRSQGLEALDIIQFLQISKYKKLMEDDIVQNFQDYQLFPLLQKAKQYGIHDVFDLCMEQLEREGFQQMRYCKFHLLSCREDVFKEVLNKNNQRRWEDPGFGLGDKLIYQLIVDYCRHNSYSQKQKSTLIKQFNELSIKTDFPLTKCSKTLTPPLPPLKFKDNDSKITIKVYTPRTTNTNSFLINPRQYNEVNQEDNNSSKSMIIDLTYTEPIKRKPKSIRPTDSNDMIKLTCEVSPLIEQNNVMERQYEIMRINIDKMNKTLKLRDQQLNNSKYRLSEIERLLEECQKSLMERNREIRLLEVRINKVQTRRLKRHQSAEDNQEEQSDDENEEGTSRKDEKLSVSLIQSKWVCC